MISSSFLFSNTNSLFNTFAVHGIDVTFVDATDVNQVAAAVRETAPGFRRDDCQSADRCQILGIGALCESEGIVYVVDNTMTTPYLFTPKTVSASMVVNSLTKYIGHANALGGAITETGLFDWQVFPNLYDNYKKGDPASWAITQIKKKGLRDLGASLGAEAAHHISVGSDTLALRMDRICENAQALTEVLAAHPKVKRVYYQALQITPNTGVQPGCSNIMAASSA